MQTTAKELIGETASLVSSLIDQTTVCLFVFLPVHLFINKLVACTSNLLNAHEYRSRASDAISRSIASLNRNTLSCRYLSSSVGDLVHIQTDFVSEYVTLYCSDGCEVNDFTGLLMAKPNQTP